MDRVKEENRNTLEEWQSIYSTKENAERWTMWHNDDLVTKFCAILPKNAEVLDVGTGAGFGPRVINTRRKDIRWSGCDFSPNAIAYLEKHSGMYWHSLQIADIRKGLPYQDQQFQIVMCTELLEHLEDPEQAVKELARVARETLIVSTPFRNVVDAEYHIWSYEPEDILQFLAPYGTSSTMLAREDRQIIGICRRIHQGCYKLS